ncbi:MAG: C1 family peptidase [Spirochaetota bacterium]
MQLFWKQLLFLLLLITTNLLPISTKTNWKNLKLDSYEYFQSIPEVNYPSSNTLPANIDFSSAMPPSRDAKASSASSAVWAVHYSAYSYTNYGQNATKKQFSPEFAYQALARNVGKKISLAETLHFLVSKGALVSQPTGQEKKGFLSLFLNKPSKKQFHQALKHRATGFARVDFSSSQKIKSLLAQKIPVIAGILITSRFKNSYQQERYVFRSMQGEFSGAQAIVLVGYDDALNAYKIQTPWANNWGNKGFAYVDYQFFSQICRSAYVITAKTTAIPLPQAMSTIPIDKDIAAPEKVFASQSSATDPILISWDAMHGAIGYEVYRSEPNQKKFVAIGKTTNNYLLDSGAVAHASYTYKVRTVSENGYSSLSQAIAIGQMRRDTKIPPRVTGLAASHGAYRNKIQLQWHAIPNVTGYEIFRWNEKSNTYLSIGKTSRARYLDTKVRSQEKTETYRVAAYSKKRLGELSLAAIGYTYYEEKPKAPSGVLASLGNFRDKIRIVWNPVTLSDSYLVYRFYNGQWKKIGSSKKEFFEDQKPPRGKVYYAIAAKGTNGIWGEYSKPVFGYTTNYSREDTIQLATRTELHSTFAREKKVLTLSWKSSSQETAYIWSKNPGDTFWQKIANTDKQTVQIKLPKEETFFLYTVTHSKAQPQKQNYPFPVAAVYSQIKPSSYSPKKRAFDTSSTLEKFKGKWIGLHWDGKGPMRNVVLNIKAGDSKNQTYNIEINGKKQYQGEYIEDSPIIEIEGKVKIKLTYTESSLMVHFEDPQILNSKTMLSFLRE